MKTPQTWNRSSVLFALALFGSVPILAAKSLFGHSVIFAYAGIIALLTLAHCWRSVNYPRWLTLVGALIFVYWAPDLSDDYHRYLWEGYVQQQGYSPYQMAPSELELTVNHSSAGKVNNPGLTAIYPPLAQILFLISSIIYPSIWGWKILICLITALAYFRDPSSTLRLMALPIVLVEGFWNAHLDLIGILPLLFLSGSMDRGKHLRAGMLLGLSCAIKIVPIIWFPFIWQATPKNQRLKLTLGLLLTCLPPLLPYLNNGSDLFASFLTYTRTWSFNNLPFHLTSAVLDSNSARVLLAICFAASYIFLFFCKASWRKKLISCWIAMIVFSPTFYPWYLLWLVPFMRGREIPWFSASYLAATLSYTILFGFRTTGVWQESYLWLIPEWVLLSICFGAIIWVKPNQTEIKHDY